MQTLQRETIICTLDRRKKLMFLTCLFYIIVSDNTAVGVSLSQDNEDITNHFSNSIQPTILQRLTSNTEETFCNYEFKKQTFGVISSPGYPSWYPSNVTCHWRIKMHNNTRVVITVREFFLTPGDQLEVNDGKKTDTYTLQNPPNSVLFLSNNKITLSLRASNDTGNYSSSKPRLFYALFEQEGCGGELTQHAGYINVPLYIHGTKRPRECLWTVMAGMDKVITLEFMQFDMEPGSCIYNTLYVRDGDQAGGYVLGEFCEENPPLSKLRTVTNTLSIAYRVRPHLFIDDPFVLPFIKMFYQMVDSCGGEMEGYSGSLASPSHWPRNRYSCIWKITVPESKVIRLKITNWRKRSSFEELEELVISKGRNGNQTSVLWSSQANEFPPESLIIPNNKGTVSFTANTERTSNKPVIHFKVSYEAVQPSKENCFEIDDKQYFMCSNEQYISCSKRCNGVSDCQSEIDEANCPIIGHRRTADFIHKEEVDDLQANKQNGWVNYIILWGTAITISLSLMGLLILGDQMVRKFNARPVPMQPPPYRKYDTISPVVCTTSTEPPHPLPPPSYESSDISIPSELVSRTQSVPFNLDSVTGDSLESIRRQRHSTPFSYFSSNSTLQGSIESIPRGRLSYISSTDGSTESISRSTNHGLIPVTALFHDTDVIGSTTSLSLRYSNTPDQMFRFTESQTDHEDFIREIQQFNEPDIS